MIFWRWTAPPSIGGAAPWGGRRQAPWRAISRRVCLCGALRGMGPHALPVCLWDRGCVCLWPAATRRGTFPGFVLLRARIGAGAGCAARVCAPRWWRARRRTLARSHGYIERTHGPGSQRKNRADSATTDRDVDFIRSAVLVRGRRARRARAAHDTHGPRPCFRRQRTHAVGAGSGGRSVLSARTPPGVER